ncbi:MAG: carbohydrate binding family 9 domain-containing protein [Bacteroidia bacterium]|nr:carbohydrate binding family 9 domain-containing protein [Bacteroidia bacterium]
MKRNAFSTFLIMMCSSFLSAQVDQAGDENFPPPSTTELVHVQKAKGRISVDGKLNETDWVKAAVISDFFRREPRQGGDIKYKTYVRFLYDEKFLYVGAFCHDSMGAKGIRVQDLRRDFSWGVNDIFGVALDPQNLKQYAQAFQTTPYGNQRDFQNFNGSNFDDGWNTLWTVRTQRTDSGFMAEFAIPFKTLRYDSPKDGQAVEWGVTLVRYARRDIEVSSFPAIPQSFTPYRMTYAAKLVGIEVPPPSANVRVEPYALYQNDRIREGGEWNANNNAKFGGEVKWAINPRSVLDLTFNTDFAQADVDRAVNNLERFNIFFPERRQFFLENSGIWAGGSQTAIRPFFSRRIGLQGNFNAAPAPIQAGVRYTQRTEKQAVAALFVRQGATENSPVSNFGVARYLRNYGRENNVGVMVTHRLDEQSSELGLDENNNTTFTIDGQIRPSSEWDIQYMLTTSMDEETGETGFAGRFFAGNRSNKFYYGWGSEYIGAKYNPGMGFVRQNDLLSHNPGGYFIVRPKKINWIRRWDPGVFASYNHDASNPANFQQANLYIFPLFMWFKDNSFVEFSITPTWQNINFEFAPLGLSIAQDNYYYTRYRLRYNTDQSKKWSLSSSYNFGGFYNGTRNSFFASGRLAPFPNAALTASYEYNDIRSVGINNEDLMTNLFTLGGRFAVNPRLQLSVFYQYNSFNRQGRWNLRTSWEYQPLSFIYVVFNDSQVDDLLNPSREQQFVSKITFVRQF